MDSTAASSASRPRATIATSAPEDAKREREEFPAEARQLVAEPACRQRHGDLVGIHDGRAAQRHDLPHGRDFSTYDTLPLARTQILPLAIASLLARHPGLHVATVESPYDALAASLRSGDIDFILGALRPAQDTPEFVQEALFDDRISLIVRAGASIRL